MLTDSQLMRIMPHLKAERAALMLPHLNATMARCEVNTLLRTAAFVAQLAHESGEFRFMEEIWGPTAQQRRYDPPDRLARDLGNTQAGDGKRYKGRGPIQITGRANYKRFGELLGLDLVGQPELASQPGVGFLLSGMFWVSRGLNEFADAQDFVKITKRINGGTTGLADRQAFYERAKAVLAEGFIADAAPAGARGARAAPLPPLPRFPARGLKRGAEAITKALAAAPVKRVPAKQAPAKKSAVAKKTAAKTKR